MANLDTRATITIVDKASPQIRRINRSLATLGRGLDKAGRSGGRGLVRANRALQTMQRTTGRAVVRTGQLSRAMVRVESRASRAARALRRFGAAALGALPRLTGILKRTAIGMGAATAGLVAASAGLAKMMVGPAAQMEQYRASMKALYGGDSAKANQAMEWIVQFAKTTPLQLSEVIDAFIRLKSFGVDPMNGSLKALVDTMAGFGRGSEFLQGEILAIGKAWAKGKLQGEIFDMLHERGIPAAQLLGKAMGKSSDEILKMGSKGQLTRKHIALLVALLGKRFAGASDEAMKTLKGLNSNLDDTWWNFRRLAGEAKGGPLEVIKNKLESLLNVLGRLDKDGTLKSWAEKLGKAVGSVLNAVIPDAEKLETALKNIDPSKYLTPENVQAAIQSLKDFGSATKDTLSLIRDIVVAMRDLANWLSRIGGTIERTKKRMGAILTGDKKTEDRIQQEVEYLKSLKATPSMMASMKRKSLRRSPIIADRVVRETRGPLKPGVDLARVAAESMTAGATLGQRAGETIVSKGTQIGDAIAAGIQRKASSIGASIGQAVAEQIRAAIAGARLQVNPVTGVRPVGPRQAPVGPAGTDAPAPLASQ